MLSRRIATLLRINSRRHYGIVRLSSPITTFHHSATPTARSNYIRVKRSLHQSVKNVLQCSETCAKTRSFKIGRTGQDEVPSSSHVDMNEEEGGNTMEYSPEELKAGPEMLKRIVEELQREGTTFILPLGDEDAMNAIAEPLKNLISAGVRPEFVIDACVKRPQLLRAFARQGAKSFALIEILVDNCAMTFEDAIRLFSSFTEEMLGVEPESVQGRLSVLVGCNVSAGHSLGRAVRKCPAVLFGGTPKSMGLVAESLSGFFSRAQINFNILGSLSHKVPVSFTHSIAPGPEDSSLKQLIMRLRQSFVIASYFNSVKTNVVVVRALDYLAQISTLVANAPHVLLSNMEDLEPKYEYIYYHMCIEEGEFGDCERWVEMPLEEIIMRHEFLLKTGRYTTPDPKRPQFKMENPVLKQILDTPEGNFATEVAGVSTEEWLIYKGLTDKLKRQSGKERPFERIKPSVRKAYERRRKEGDQKQEYLFDAGDNEIYKWLTDKLKRQSGKERPFERIKPSVRKAYERRRKEGDQKQEYLFDAGDNEIYKWLTDKLKRQSGKERPFERIKPSVRKAYERRRKEGDQKQEYLFDAGDNEIYKWSTDKLKRQLGKERPFERIKPSVRKAYERRRKEGDQKQEYLFDAGDNEIYKWLTDKLKRQSGKERPFERIKPSVRKAYERRRKEGDQKQEYLFDAGDNE